MAGNDRYILQSLANALDILDLLTVEEELSVPEIAKKCGLGKSSVFRIMATLEDRHFVRKSERATYKLDIKFAAMGNAVTSRLEIVGYAHPYLMQLTQKVGETSHLAVWDRGTTVRFVDKVLSRSTIRTDSEIGFGREAHLLACGKTLLAWQSPDFQDSYMSMADFTPLTPHTITSPERLRQELAQIRAEGYGTDLQESELGLVCFAAPIRDRTGRVAAAVSISGPAQRMLDNRDLNVAAVRAAAEQISAAIG